MGPETKKFQFLPYFRDGNIKSIVLFDSGKNEEFLQELEGHFNLLDERGNRILTKCKLDNPYCNTHLPQKNSIYGRDKYVATKFYHMMIILEELQKLRIDEKDLKNIEINNRIKNFAGPDGKPLTEGDGR